VPLIIAGSALLMALLTRFPVLVWLGAALLGWIAGEIIVKDSFVVSYLGDELVHRIHLFCAAAGALLVVGLGWAIKRMKRHEPLDTHLVVDPPGPEEFPPRRAAE
jgi:predicted tellurium resistance membrane protein TerC